MLALILSVEFGSDNLEVLLFGKISTRSDERSYEEEQECTVTYFYQDVYFIQLIERNGNLAEESLLNKQHRCL